MGAALPYELNMEMWFDRRVKKAFKNEINDCFREQKTRSKYELLFCDLPNAESIADIPAIDIIDSIGLDFQVQRYTVTVRDELLYDALSQIDERARNIVLMYEWVEMSDREIAEDLRISTRWVNNIRQKAYRTLKLILEDNGYHASIFFHQRE